MGKERGDMQHNRQKVSESPSCATTHQISLSTQSRRSYANESARLGENTHTHRSQWEDKRYIWFNSTHFEDNICEL